MRGMAGDRLLVACALVAGLGALAVMVVFVGQGNARHVEIFWEESVEQTVVLEEAGGRTQVRAVGGVLGGANPTLVGRTSFAYVLTVINNGTEPHRLHIGGLGAETGLLAPGERETLTMHPAGPGEFTYYEAAKYMVPLGKIRIVSVVPSDEFSGVWRDLV